ncbi:GRIP and coiled-coil domain-containing protein 2 isoform X2 [Rhinatrema bivittatum]|uniref:GRIP and coiled-coil domain-containing protein 2 isoform X2 n=1 Tax=Rhinatrema bivittatum TaxID=194408 RepID=UPI00112D6349|nr:GRIP and coiled-coil domain-containing protein 2 isoform X2 [Rhinatrema bivittatum]
MEDTAQDMVASPSMPGMGKSRLDTLPKEELIKFAKKQVMLLQKVKSKCTELEKEIKELKSKPAAEASEDIIQALTVRLDNVLLEKAETQQQLLMLKKENAKETQKVEDAITKTDEVQKQWETSNAKFLKEIECLKAELVTAQANHKEDVTRLQTELQDCITKQGDLTDQLGLKGNQEDEIQRLQEELQQIKPAYEKQISCLTKKLEVVMEEKEQEITSLQEAQKLDSERNHDEISNLHQELLKVNSAHQEEMSGLLNQLEASAKDYEQQGNQKDQQIQCLREQFLAKEASLQEELNTSKEKYECELERLQKYVRASKENHEDFTKGQDDPSADSKADEKVHYLDTVLKDLESKHSILKDELTYTNNVKIKLEMEVQQLKDEYFHDREDLDFKINELQLAREDYSCIIEKLKSELQNAKDHHEVMSKQHNLRVQALEGQHVKEMSDLNEALISASEKEKLATAFEMQLLQEQHEKLLQEKEEAVSSYESLKETMVTLQAELGESAGKISQEFEAMKQQQAADVQELQQKLRVAYKEKDALGETVKTLQAEAGGVSAKQEESEEMKQTIGSLQKENEEVMALLDQRDTAIHELEGKMNLVVLERDDVLTKMKFYQEGSSNLQEECERERTRGLELQHKAEELDKHNSELKQNVEELSEKLKELSTEKDQSCQRLEGMEKQIEAFTQEKEKLLNETQALQDEMAGLHAQKTILGSELEQFTCEREGWLVFKEQAEDLEKKLEMVTEEKCQLSKLLESGQQQNEVIRTQLSSLLEEMGYKHADGGQEKDDVLCILQAVKKSIVQITEENQSAVLRSDERTVNLQKELERLQEEHEAQCTELRALAEDHGRERVLLREELAAGRSEKEALQEDLLEMKSANEKSRLENQGLLAHIEELTEKLEHHGRCTEERPEGFSTEICENLKRLLEERESQLCDLKVEITALKDSIEKSSAEERDQRSEIAEMESKIGHLEKESKERDDKLNKIKAVAVKAKKELDSSRKEVQSVREELEVVRAERDQLSSSMKDLIHGAESYKNLLLEYDKQAEQLDVEKERAGNSERQTEEFLKQLRAAVAQQDHLRSDKEDLLTRVDTLQSNTKLLEAQILDMQKARAAVDKELEAEKLLREQKIKDHSGTLKQLEDLQMELHKEKKQLQKTLQELELVRKDAQKSTLMDMEIADYDRLVKELNHMIMEKKSQLEDLEHELKMQNQKQEILQEEITSLHASVEDYEEKSTKMKQLLVNTKKELADLKQVETDHLLLQASLKGELEANQQQVEIYKIQVAELTAEKHKVQEQLRISIEQQQRSISTYQQKIAALQDACSTAKAEQAAVQSEFEGYKVRVHNVLKQQKNKSASQLENETVKQEREHMEMKMEQLKAKLQDTQQNLHINVTELQTLQMEHDTLLDRHNKMLQETVAKEAELREKLCTVQSENMVLKSEQAQTVSQLTAQNEALRNSFRDQVRQLQEDHRKTMESLQEQLSKVETQLFQLKSEPSITSSASSHQPMKNLRDRRNPDLPPLDMYKVAREEGEGMETTETESLSSTSTHVPSLEQLLNSPEAKLEPPQWQPDFSKEELVQKLNTTAKSVDHLNGLLHETEATNAILMEQITLLKNEIRRLERNQEREKSVANLEYLKNVLLQFIFLKAGSERQRLLPVIDTMLHLSPEEKGKLVEITQGEEESASRSSGWASYLHSWSGLR